MRRATGVVALSCTAAIAHGLSISRPGSIASSDDAFTTFSFGRAAALNARRTPEKEGASSRDVIAGSSDVPLNGSTGMSSRDNFGDSHDASYYSCSGSGCTVNTTRMESDLQSGLILVLGCSLDINALEHFCNAAHAPFIGKSNNFGYMAHCTMAGFTIAYAFHPGASAPPYWRDYVGTLTSQQIILQSSQDVKMLFGREPTAIVVDSSLWDVSNWWQRYGAPPEPYAVPHADITRWCNTDVPHLLSWVDAAYPRSGIAFRTPPPVFQGNAYGQSPQIIEEMVACVRRHSTDSLAATTPTGSLELGGHKVYSKYQLIDFNKLVETFFLHHPGPRLQFYSDVLHPGRQLSMTYMNAVLQWVRGLRHVKPGGRPV